MQHGFCLVKWPKKLEILFFYCESLRYFGFRFCGSSLYSILKKMLPKFRLSAPGRIWSFCKFANLQKCLTWEGYGDDSPVSRALRVSQPSTSRILLQKQTKRIYRTSLENPDRPNFVEVHYFKYRIHTNKRSDFYSKIIFSSLHNGAFCENFV